MVRGRDACWEHCVLVDPTRQKVRCNYCQREFSGGVYRMKFHLAQIKNKDIVPCAEVPTEVRDHILGILSTPRKQKVPKKSKVDMETATNGQQHSSSTSGDIHHGSSGQNESNCPSAFRCPSPSPQPPMDDIQKQKQDDADKQIAIFFFHNSIPFCAAKSIYFQEMVNAIAEYGVSYKAPSYEKLRSTLLEKVKSDIQNSYEKYKDELKETGCTILCDSWSDGRSKSFLAFSIACSKGTLFLKSVDVSSHEDDPTFLSELLETMVLEVGVENVVQIITDATAGYVYAGRILMAKYTSLFWSPCVSYCVNMMLEEISAKNERVGTVLEEAKIVTDYIYSHAWILNTMRKFTNGKELIRPRISRFVTNFLSLRSIVNLEDNLKHMFSHSKWLSSVYSRHPDAQAITSLLYLDRFWQDAHEAVSISEPLTRILRIVEGDMPAMGYVYEGMERAKAKIKAYYKGIEKKYMPVWDIIDGRWKLQLHTTLHAAAAFLNPSIFYNPNFKIDMQIRNGFQEAMLKMVTADKDKMEITKEHPKYVNGQGALGSDFAIMGRTLNAPGDWWSGFGYEVPTLQRAAIRILSQPCSSYWYGWNWSTFDSLHSKKRNRMEWEKFSNLVFVHCNLWLQSIPWIRDGKFEPIVFDEIDIDSEWPTEFESSPLALDDSWLDNLPLECRVSP